MNGKRTRWQAGFSLIELAVVLIIAGIVMKYGLEAYAGYAEQEFRETTKQRLSAVEEALVLYAQRNRRLPCPADGTLAVTNAQSGVEKPNPAVTGDTTNCMSAVQYSVVPWRTLGIPQDVANDAWNRRITYRVADGTNGVTRNRTAGSVADGLNMTECRASALDSSSLGAAACPSVATFRSPTDFLVNKGLTVQDGSGNSIRDKAASTGAAFVLISHGKDGKGAYTKDGVKVTNPTGTLQLDNVSHTASTLVYRMAPLNEGPSSGTNYFDDFVLAPTIHSIAVRANLGPQ